MSKKQGEFLNQLRQRPEPAKPNRFSWSDPVAKPKADKRIFGAPGVSSLKADAPPAPEATPTDLKGKIDRDEIDAQLAKQLKKQRKAK